MVLNPKTRICVVGLGYVGLPLAVAFSRQFQTLGFDIDADRIQELSQQIDKTESVKPEGLSAALSSQQLLLCSHINQVADCDFYIITVPTPVTAEKQPDLGPLTTACTLVGQILKPKQVVVFESTVYPGCTEEVCAPLLAKIANLEYNRDFYCGYSPERINPGDTTHTVETIVKVTSGSTPEIATLVDQLYATIVTAGTHKAPSIKVAEASKAIENAQRDVNISFVNELAVIFDKMDIDTYDVLEAASTKWNFLPFKPGLVGGHCIGVDPYYLAYQAKKL
ncbi:MAG: nucleotide sugar dehydrogenase [Bacteroidota bacterium]